MVLEFKKLKILVVYVDTKNFKSRYLSFFVTPAVHVEES